MAARKRVGLFYESYQTFPALVIYIQNIVRVLSGISEERKPTLIIIHVPGAPVHELKETGYSYMEFYELKNVYRNPLKRAVNKLWRVLRRKNLIPYLDKDFPKNLDTVFPYDYRKETDYVRNKVAWKPDFQEFHFPQYFGLRELRENLAALHHLSGLKIRLVLSSQDAKRDYEKYFPDHRNDIRIWRFSSSLPDFHHTDRDALLKTHRITKKYFLVANQFWPHKNHLNVLKALAACGGNNAPFQVVFTGKQSSYRDAELFEKLKLYCEVNKIEGGVVFTGFLDRPSQLSLMSGAVAVVQPSLFEGWSTVIEDCKAIGQRVIASDISVNREQLGKGGLFFNPYDFHALSSVMQTALSLPAISGGYNMKEQIEKFSAVVLETLTSD
jgi:glycosyltransferase involved in cell wall biosynthesis